MPQPERWYGNVATTELYGEPVDRPHIRPAETGETARRRWWRRRPQVDAGR